MRKGMLYTRHQTSGLVGVLVDWLRSLSLYELWSSEPRAPPCHLLTYLLSCVSELSILHVSVSHELWATIVSPQTHSVFSVPPTKYHHQPNRPDESLYRRSVIEHLSTAHIVVLQKTGSGRCRSTLCVPAIRRSSLGDRAFPVAAARLWNTLPISLRTVLSYLTFRRELKTFLFNISFPDNWTVCVTL